MVIRYQEDGPSSTAVIVRELYHFELARLIGWDIGAWKQDVDRSSWDLCAFGYAFDLFGL